MLAVRLLPRLSCIQCPRMSRWARRGQCHGRLVRPGSSARQRQESPVFHPISRRWQERQCRRLRLPLSKTLNLARSRPAPLLRHREPCLVHEIGGDGNCLFRCLSLVITGSESFHNLVRQRIVSHISENCKAFSALLPESPRNGNAHADACAHYLSTSKMATGATWGSDVEILAAAHLLHTRIFVYTMHGSAWQWVEHGMELTEPGRKPCKESIYLMHTGLVHYDLVEDVEKSSDAGKDTSPTLASSSRRISNKASEKAGQYRGYIVPCTRPDTHSDSGQRSSSRNSSISSYSSSSIDSNVSCGESLGSSVSHSNASAACSKRRRPGVTSSSARQRFLPTSSSYTCNNNNSLMKKMMPRNHKINLNPSLKTASNLTKSPSGALSSETLDKRCGCMHHYGINNNNKENIELKPRPGPNNKNRTRFGATVFQAGHTKLGARFGVTVCQAAHTKHGARFGATVCQAGHTKHGARFGATICQAGYAKHRARFGTTVCQSCHAKHGTRFGTTVCQVDHIEHGATFGATACQAGHTK
ncbi:hypothetical protein RRG08_037006 [Elysia crispata]|uniref:OTU domain-containing protein n=1 Tax=Elysia crispata TaxID=231223 RepID=A0AAE0XTS0_9GAST|nr:hypothetical protein RRG08_037006 [Elysia crispata]